MVGSAVRLILCVLHALASTSSAWMTQGELPALPQSTTYAGKFCFDYVASDDAAQEISKEDAMTDAASCEVQLTTQLSEYTCTYGKSFGCRADITGTMWVSDGCRGDFTLNGAPLTCDSWGKEYAKCTVPPVPTSGYLEVELRGQMLEEEQTDGTQAHMFLMMFDDESQHWARAKHHLDALTCTELRDLANGAFPVSSELTSSPFHMRQVIRIREHLRPRFWHFVFVNCGAKNVLVPVTYSLHARNIRQGFDAEFGIDAYKSVPLEVFFGMVFCLIVVCVLRATWNRMLSRPLFCLLGMSAACSAAGCLLLAVHHKVYASNGHGFFLAGALGLLFSCASKALFMVLQFLIAKGWALFFAPEERGQMYAIAIALLTVVGLSLGCEIYDWLFRDSSTDLYIYESTAGFVILGLNLGLLFVAWFLTWTSSRRETSQDVRAFYLQVSVASGLYFSSLPLVYLLVQLLNPWVRQCYIERVELCARLLSTTLLLLVLWPQHLDSVIGARMKGRLGALTDDDEDLPAIDSAQQHGGMPSLSGDDEEHGLTSKHMGFEAGLLVQ